MALDSREKLQRRIGELEDENKKLVQKVVELQAVKQEMDSLLHEVHAKLVKLMDEWHRRVEEFCDNLISGQA